MSNLLNYNKIKKLIYNLYTDSIIIKRTKRWKTEYGRDEKPFEMNWEWKLNYLNHWIQTKKRKFTFDSL